MNLILNAVRDFKGRDLLAVINVKWMVHVHAALSSAAGKFWL